MIRKENSIFNIPTIKSFIKFILIVFLIVGCNQTSQISGTIEEREPKVLIAGQMKDVMMNGELSGSIDLDTIQNKEGLYGVGPEEYLRTELLIIDGKSYKSTVLTDSTMKVEETFKVSAPFFVYSNVVSWKKQKIPDSIQTIQQLDNYIGNITATNLQPFVFKLSGIIDLAKIHIVNLPKGTKVSSPNDAHKGQVNYEIENRDVEIIGFFSTQHKGIFTHHDSNLHMHLISKDRKLMGHLDEILLGDKEVTLYLPEK